MTKKSQTTELTHILIKGACEHNLKNIDVSIPKKSLVVITGVSGSGKTSLAFDTLFAEGQRRYIESLSSYARQFLGQMEKPKYEMIQGLSPTISIEQKTASKNPRSTVGTITEIYDYLRVLYARIGTQYCHICGKKVGRGDATSMVEQILKMPEGTPILIMAPVIENRKGEHREILSELSKSGFVRVRLNGAIIQIADVQALDKNKKHNIEVVVDRLKIQSGNEFRRRLTDSVETAIKQGIGQIIVHVEGREDIHMSEARSCCKFAFPKLEPSLLSFNTPMGMCPTCHGIGSILSMNPAKIIPDPTLTIRQGAIVPWKNYFLHGDETNDSWGWDIFNAMQKQWNLDWDRPWNDLPEKQKNLLLYGAKGKDLKIHRSSDRMQGSWTMKYEGLVNTLMRRYQATKSEGMKTWYEKFMSGQTCNDCKGQRLKPELLHVKIGGKSIMDLCTLTPVDIKTFLNNLKLSPSESLISIELLKEINSRLGFLINVGLDYLTLDRSGPSLSGGEAQRIRLASQIGSELTGVLYILDEPSIGLHQRDNKKLLKSLQRLRDIGNTLIVIEHDRETMESADWIIDMGPGAGHLGGQIVAAGTPGNVMKNRHSLTGRYLANKERIKIPENKRTPKNDPSSWIEIIEPRENNLRVDSAKIPLGLFTCITGVSGAGKSTLVNQILLPALSFKLHDANVEIGKHKKITGINNIDKVIEIDQKPIGRTPRSNPATYTKLFDPIRDLFAQLPEATVRGYSKGRFSFNVKGGRCETCQGDGFIRVEMHFLADVFVPCDVCKGRRFNEQTLEVKYKTHSIADILDLSIIQAREVFTNQPKIVTILDTLIAVGLGYIKLGQPATTLSGGEAQRVKLSRELAKRDTGRTLYVLDEPTTGLHFHDIKNLLSVLQSLVDAGNTVVVIEHNLEVIKCADWIIDLGPEGGDKGGKIIAEGPIEKVMKNRNSYTGQFLKESILL